MTKNEKIALALGGGILAYLILKSRDAEAGSMPYVSYTPSPSKDTTSLTGGQYWDASQQKWIPYSADASFDYSQYTPYTPVSGSVYTPPPEASYPSVSSYPQGTHGGVRQLQQLLSQRGFDPGPIDGIYGPRTRAAILAFQRSVGLAQSGYFDTDTVAGLMRGASQPVPTSGFGGPAQRPIPFNWRH